MGSNSVPSLAQTKPSFKISAKAQSFAFSPETFSMLTKKDGLVRPAAFVGMGLKVLGLELDIFTLRGIREEPEIEPIDFAVGLVVAELLLSSGDDVETVVASIGISPFILNRINPTSGPLLFMAVSPLDIGAFGRLHHLPELFEFSVGGVQVARPRPEALKFVLQVETRAKGPNRSLTDSGKILGSFHPVLFRGVGVPPL